MSERKLYTAGDYMGWVRHACWSLSARGTPFVRVVINIRYNIQMRDGSERFFPEPIRRDRTTSLFLELEESRKEYNRLVLMDIGWKGRSIETLGADCRLGAWVRAHCWHDVDKDDVIRERWRIRTLPRPMNYDKDDPVAMDEAEKFVKLRDEV